MRTILFSIFTALSFPVQAHGPIILDVVTPSAQTASFDLPIELTMEAHTHSGCTDCHPSPIILTQSQIDVAALAQSAITRVSTSAQRFIWPATGVFESPFDPNRLHPVYRSPKPHNGIDLSGNNGSAVVAAADGIVVVSDGGCRANTRARRYYSCHGGRGNNVSIVHADGTWTNYFHLSPHCRLPRRNQPIKQGEKLGCVGNTGTATGPHLHFEIQTGPETYIDPVPLLPEMRNE